MRTVHGAVADPEFCASGFSPLGSAPGTEAVKDKMVRSSSSERRIGREEALNRHMTVCKKFRAKIRQMKPKFR
uniref:Uncharacterized protein LOC104241078 n=1 Tax=Nicotiana sylvestris TaxID=4096 RepID=A0A1U7Y4W6_NICSY|nr:PREDICTED: uncharacterized protein LOC104241078 [Nicotiana sylvestris]